MSSATDNLVLFLPLDSITNNTTPDKSGYGLNLTLSGSPQLVEDPTFGSVIRFNGSNQYGTSAASDLNGALNSSNQNFSFSGWIKINQLTTHPYGGSYSVPATFFSSAQDNIDFKIKLGVDNNGTLIAVLYYQDGITSFSFTETHFQEDKWHFIALTFSSTELVLFLDGASQSFSITRPLPNIDLIAGSYPVIIGGDPYDSQYFNGYLSHIRFYGRTLTAVDIPQIMAADLSDGVVGHYPLSEIVNGNQTPDVAHSGTYATIVNGATLLPDVTFGSCLNFDSSNYQSVSCTPDFGSSTSVGALTAEVWIQTDQSGQLMSLISFNSSEFFGLYVGNSQGDPMDTISFVTCDQNGISNTLVGTQTVVGAGWVHVAATYDSSTGLKTIYINGDLDSQAQGHSPGSMLGTIINTGYFAEDPFGGNNSLFDGQMSNVRLYAEARSQAQIDYDMAADATSISSYFRLYPIAFDIFEENQEQVIYIYDEPSGHKMEVKVYNTSDRPVQLNALPEASASSFHFALAFRPGTLSDQALQDMTLQNAGSWNVYGPLVLSDNTQVIYLASSTDQTMMPQSSLSLIFDNVSADPTGGSRGTRVELSYTNMNYQGDATMLTGDRIIQVGIVNHAGLKELPLFAGFLGSNWVQIGASNSLTLRLTNTLPYDSTQPNANKLSFSGINSDAPTTFSFRMDVDSNGDEEWALISSGTVSTVSAEGSGPSNGTWVYQPEISNNPPVWELTPQDDFELGPGEYFDLTIEGIYPEAPMSHSNLYLDYRNIPGYWDGTMVKVVEKGPLSLNNTSLGIGTTVLKEKLNVMNGDVAVRSQDGQDYGIAMQSGSDSNVQYGWHLIQKYSTKHLEFNYIGSSNKSSGTNWFTLDHNTGNLTLPGSGGLTSGGAISVNAGGLNVGNGDLHVSNGKLTIGNTVSSNTDKLLVNGNNIGVQASSDSSPVGYAFRKVGGGAQWYLWQSNGSFGISGSSGTYTDPANIPQRLKITNSGSLTVSGANQTLTMDSRDGGTNNSSGRLALIGSQVVGYSDYYAKIDFENQQFQHDSSPLTYNSIRALSKSDTSGKIELRTRDKNGNLKSRLNISGTGVDVANGNFTVNNIVPFQLQRIEIPGSANTYDTGVSVDAFGAAITGFAALDGDINENGTHNIIQVYVYEVTHSGQSSTWGIKCKFATHNNSENWWIDIMFIRKELCTMTNFETIPSH